jgi:hypothetical protein
MQAMMQFSTDSIIAGGAVLCFPRARNGTYKLKIDDIYVGESRAMQLVN